MIRNLRAIFARARLSDQESLAAFYPRLGDALKRQFPGWHAYLLTGDLLTG